MPIDISILFLTLFTSIILYQTFNKIFVAYNIIDKVNDRSSHSVIATRSGGLAIVLNIFFISLYFYFNNYTIYDYSILIPLLLLTFIGLYDDIYRLDFKLKFIFQIIAAKILIDNGLLIDNLHGFFGIFELNRILAQFITIFIIVAIINAINFIDGIDILAISIVSIFIFLFELSSSVSTPFYNLNLLLILSIIPLFYFNLKKNKKVFLGDSGSHFLGGITSIYVIYILTNEYTIKPNFDLHKLLFVVSILIYPIIDLLRIVQIRLLEKKSPFSPDNKHIHHVIYRKTDNHLITTIIISLFSISFFIIIQIIF